MAQRSWYVCVDPGPFLDPEIYLTSWRGTRWDGPVLTADALPAPGNENGVYARPMGWTPGPYFFWGGTHDSRPKAYGTVALTGRVIQGLQGYRAERATIRELWLWTPPGPVFLANVRELLEQRYQCHVHLDEAPPWTDWVYL